jgi:hypothetical protein
MTKREKILESYRFDSEDMDEIKKSEIGKISPIDLDTTPLPAIFVFSGNQRRVPGIIGCDTWEWPVILEVWAKDTVVEDLIGKIYIKMMDNEHRSIDGGPNNAEESYLSSIDIHLVDPTRRLVAFSLEFTVGFDHPIGQP